VIADVLAHCRARAVGARTGAPARRSRTDRARRPREEGREDLCNALTRTFRVGKAGFEPATSASRTLRAGFIHTLMKTRTRW
jgi:hypothetical protein